MLDGPPRRPASHPTSRHIQPVSWLCEIVFQGGPMSSTVATRPKSTARRGTLYLGGTGMLTWLLHRISGIAVVYFLTLHIYEALQLFGGPAAYNEATAAYKQPWFRPFEVALILAVTYHALNGLRVSMFDLFPETTRYHRRI